MRRNTRAHLGSAPGGPAGALARGAAPPSGDPRAGRGERARDGRGGAASPRPAALTLSPGGELAHPAPRVQDRALRPAAGQPLAWGEGCGPRDQKNDGG